MASSVIAVLITAGVVVVVLVMGAAAVSLRRSARELRELAGELSEHATAVLGDAEETVRRAQGHLDRVDDLVGSAEAISETVGSASRLAHAVVSPPLIKVLALRAGSARIRQRLFHRKPEEDKPRLRRVG